MKGFSAVVRREIVEKRGIFFGATLVGLGALAAPVFPSTHRYPASEVRLAAALFLAAAFASALSVILGSTTIGRDLSERRIGFYFARPISSGAIWAGKLAGAAALIAGGTAIALLPVGLLDFRAWRAWEGPLSAVAYPLLFLASVVFCLALGNVVSGALRARSAWIFGDLVLLVGWATSLAAIAQPLWRAQGRGPLVEIGVALVVIVAAALLVASGAQVSIGRADIARGNRARFAALWGTIGLATLGCAGFVRWFVSATPSDLVHRWVAAAPETGRWIAVEGWASWRGDFPFSFLYDVDSGRFLRLSAGREATILFSADGRVAAWADAKSGGSDLFVARLDAANPGRIATRTTVPAPWSNSMRLSEDGSRVALFGDKTVSAYEVSSGRLLASAVLPEENGREGLWRLAFPKRDVVRVYRVGRMGAPEMNEPARPSWIRIFDLDLSRRLLVARAVLGPFTRPFYPSFDEVRGRILVRQKGKSTDIFDCVTGEELATLAADPQDWFNTRFLSDGGIAAGFVEPSGGGYVMLFSADGRERKRVDLGRAGSVRIGGEPEAGKLVVATGDAPSNIRTDAHLVDLAAGSQRLIGRGLHPVATSSWFFPRLEPGSVATRLLIRTDESIALFDPKTGSLRVVLPRGSAAAEP